MIQLVAPVNPFSCLFLSTDLVGIADNCTEQAEIMVRTMSTKQLARSIYTAASFLDSVRVVPPITEVLRGMTRSQNGLKCDVSLQGLNSWQPVRLELDAERGEGIERWS